MTSPPEQTKGGHGEVATLGVACGDGGTIEWGDGTSTYVGDQGNPTHTYAYNGSYKVVFRCSGHEPEESYANVNSAIDKPNLFGISASGLSAIAALLTAVVGFLTFLAGKKSASRG